MANEQASPMIECENLVKIYKTPDVEVLALQGLEVRIERGELMAIIGNSGSGKSTFLNMIGGLDRPSAGRLVVDGKDLFKMNERELVQYKRSTVGFVWQNNARNLLPYLTAWQNVQTPMLFEKGGNKKQRALLGDGVPTRLTAQQHARIEAWQAAAEEAPCDALAYYEADGDGWALRVPVRELPFAGRRSLQEALRAALQPQLLVRPVIASFGVRERRGARALADFFVGRSTLSLTCCRPYENDENACLVRLSAENMKRLGVEEMDQVIVQHAERRVRCRVLAFCGQESLRSTNLHAPEELSVGIPAHLRGELGLTDLHTAVKVDRDTVFLLKKSVNEQVVPVLLALLSLSFFERLPWWLTVGIVVLLLPVLFYLNLSARRSMRG